MTTTDSDSNRATIHERKWITHVLKWALEFGECQSWNASAAHDFGIVNIDAIRQTDRATVRVNCDRDHSVLFTTLQFQSTTSIGAGRSNCNIFEWYYHAHTHDETDVEGRKKTRFECKIIRYMFICILCLMFINLIRCVTWNAAVRKSIKCALCTFRWFDAKTVSLRAVVKKIPY